jgi:hypothetical protein
MFNLVSHFDIPVDSRLDLTGQQRGYQFEVLVWSFNAANPNCFLAMLGKVSRDSFK